MLFFVAPRVDDVDGFPRDSHSDSTTRLNKQIVFFLKGETVFFVESVMRWPRWDREFLKKVGNVKRYTFCTGTFEGVFVDIAQGLECVRKPHPLKGWTFSTFFLGKEFIAQIRQRTLRWALRVSNCCGCMMYDWLADLLQLAGLGSTSRWRDFPVDLWVPPSNPGRLIECQKKRLKLKAKYLALMEGRMADPSLKVTPRTRAWKIFLG